MNDKDAVNPHVLILTTNIQPSGKRINIHHLGKNASEEVRKKIEAEFNLVKATGRGNRSLIHFHQYLWKKQSIEKQK